MKRLTYSEFENTPKILIGSQAASIKWSNFRDCKNSDADYFLPGEDKRFFGVNPKIGGAPRTIDANGIPEHIFDKIKENANWDIIGAQDFYTLKVSHAHFNIHWDKTMKDIAWMQYNQAYKLDETLYNMLYEYWMKIHIHGKGRINLNKTNEEFFNDKVIRVYRHDDLHEAIKYNRQPMYQFVKIDQSKAWINKKLFDNIQFEKRKQLAREEIMVTAIERFYIPYKMPLQKAYHLGAKKLICSLSKGWFPKFIIENWGTLYKPDKDYICEFEDALRSGKVRKI